MPVIWGLVLSYDNKCGYVRIILNHVQDTQDALWHYSTV